MVVDHLRVAGAAAAEEEVPLVCGAAVPKYHLESSFLTFFTFKFLKIENVKKNNKNSKK